MEFIFIQFLLNYCQWYFLEELVEDLEHFKHFHTVLIFFESCDYFSNLRASLFLILFNFSSVQFFPILLNNCGFHQNRTCLFVHYFVEVGFFSFGLPKVELQIVNISNEKVLHYFLLLV
jgi:hypothetical protein